MRNKRFMKVVSTSLLISMLACSTVFGAEINAGTGFAGALPAESYEMENDGVESLTSEQVKIKSEKEELDVSAVIKPSKARAVTWDYLDDGYTVYGQINNYYCGPATVKGALKYLTGKTYSQSTIASACGTTTSGTYLAPMVKYLNSKISSNYYVQKNGVNKTDMVNYLYSSIALYDMPPIVGIACSTADGWKYTSGGHFIAINGVTTDGSTFNIADSLIMYLGYSSGSFYDKSATTLYNAYNAVNIGLCW